MSTKKKCFNCTKFGRLATCLKFDRIVKATHTCKHFKSRRKEKKDVQ